MGGARMNVLKVADCSLVDVVKVWNEGFHDYFVPVKLDQHAFLNRLAKEDLSADASFVVEKDSKLQGVLLNGFRKRKGKMLAWNGGTAVIESARGTGIAKLLMEATIRQYEENGVQQATLEVIKENERAIALYKKFGFTERDELILFEGIVTEEEAKDLASLHVVSIRPELLSHLTFYEPDVPWQCCWESNKNAEAAVYYDAQHEPIGYALFNRVFDDNGTQISSTIYQLHLLKGKNKQMVPNLLPSIVGEAGHYSTLNTPASSAFAHYLTAAGASEKVRQIWMERTFA